MMGSNRLKTVLLLGSLTGLLLLVGYLLGGQGGVLIAFFASIVMNFSAYFYSDKYVLRAHQAKPLNPLKYPHIYKMVKELAREYQMPIPKLWYVPTHVANAFATGRNPRNGHVAVTQGILDILEPNELRAVLAHELGHIKNRDILVSTIAVTMASAIDMIANSLKWSAYAENGHQKGGGIKTLFIAIIMPVAASLIHLGISRSREYLADESGAHTSQDPLALASALKKLDLSAKSAGLIPKNPAHAATGSLFIVYPFMGKSLTALFSTHPPMEQRIALLEEMAKKIS